MAFNKQYNTRHSGRYNTSGQFVSAGELVAGAAQLQGNNIMPPRQTQQDIIMTQPSTPQQTLAQKPCKVQKQNLQIIQTMEDVDMKPELKLDTSTTSDEVSTRPHWMKSKLPGVKKISNKERRRRQNETLRRLLTPKNALMVLNEMMPNEQVASQFRVEPATNPHFIRTHVPSFRADLTLEGTSYKGYGENKLMARNAAAEQAIRDLIIKKMKKVVASDAASGADSQNDDAAAESAESPESEEALPMLQLASFALHKLFTEWECEGHKVPQLKPPAASGTPDLEAELEPPPPVAPQPRPRPVKKTKEIPPNATYMHPCMLLTYLRPHMEYRELSAEGDRPQTMIFTMGVDIDGTTFIGKAPSKKEARKMAARAACQELFNITFHDNPTSNTPHVTE